MGPGFALRYLCRILRSYAACHWQLAAHIVDQNVSQLALSISQTGMCVQALCQVDLS